jgi:hypothetical protein
MRLRLVLPGTGTALARRILLLDPVPKSVHRGLGTLGRLSGTVFGMLYLMLHSWHRR